MTAHACCHPWRQGRTQRRRAVAPAYSKSLLRDAPVATLRESLAVGRWSVDGDALRVAPPAPIEDGGWLGVRTERDARGARVGVYDGSEEAMFADVKADIAFRH